MLWLGLESDSRDWTAHHDEGTFTVFAETVRHDFIIAVYSLLHYPIRSGQCMCSDSDDMGFFRTTCSYTMPVKGFFIGGGGVRP